MDAGGLKKILIEGAMELGIRISDDTAGLFLVYLRELKAWNRKINLTSIEADRAIVVRHFLDSLTPLRFIKDGAKLLDIGAGAGFPGIPLKLAEPGLKVVLMDSVEKKVHFMRHVIRTLWPNGPSGIEAVAGRAEDPKMTSQYQAAFDAVISRAFTGLGRFVDMSLPYLRPNGLVIAIKGPSIEDELKDAKGLTGVSAPEVHNVTVPFDDRINTIVIFRKKA